MARKMPRYPVYIPSKGRANSPLTARFLLRDQVPFYMVVEPQDFDAYASAVGEDRLLVLPYDDHPMGPVPARNFIKHHAAENGHARHWQIDDNCNRIRRMWRGKRYPCRAGLALGITEDFVERYTNVAIAGLNYVMFAPAKSRDMAEMPPFQVNCHVYSCMLLDSHLKQEWRTRYNEDADYCLQVLSAGYCTLLMNAFLIEKRRTMTHVGGNTPAYYGDGRLKMSRMLERQWPGVVETDRRWGRPQHVVHSAWKKFDTPLKRRPDLVVPDGPDEQGMTLRRVGDSRRKKR